MSELGAETMRGIPWPSNGLSEIPFRLYTDPEQYRLEQERIFKGPTWSYLCLAADIAKPGDYIGTTIRDDAPDLESYLGPQVVGGIRRVLNRPVRILGHSTQVLPNNWKLYSENTKDTYHASILHSFLTTFRINRLSMPGGIHVDDSGGNHFSQAKLDYAAEDADYKREGLRADTDLRLEDPSVIESVDEYGDSVSVHILTVFPSTILQQTPHTIPAPL